jgi:hypothetical protein
MGGPAIFFHYIIALSRDVFAFFYGRFVLLNQP